MNAATKCAVYARVSSERQNPLSPTDQVRKCREYAEQINWQIVESRIFIDEAVSGVGSDRPAFQKLLGLAFSVERDFHVLLVDDTSRLSRSQPEVMSTVEKLKFLGVRVVFTSQGIDTNSEQSDLQITVHGLMDSIYVKELAKKTHRGLESRAIKGLHTGGVCFGYRSERIDESGGTRLIVNEDEAKIVRQIFEMCASGISLKGIAKELNSRLVPPPRSKSPSNTATWCHTAIREMLRREIYVGEKVWNKRGFHKVPGTNKRRSKLRPEGEVRRASVPELAIVPPDLWAAVQSRLNAIKNNGGNRTQSGLLPRGLTSPYLFSSLLKCSECGSNLIIATGGVKNRKYACAGYLNRGICSNNMYIRSDELESALLANLKNELLHPEVVSLAVEEFGKVLRSNLASLSGDIAKMRQRKEKLEGEICNLTKAIAESGHSKFILDEIAVREREIGAITDRLLSSSAESVESRINEIREHVEQEIAGLSSLLCSNPPVAKQELHRHLTAITMHPVKDSKRGWYYLAEGAWNLLGRDENAPREEPDAQDSDEGQIRMVAGAGFEPATFGL
jgi:site-specific DNA recombinase